MCHPERERLEVEHRPRVAPWEDAVGPPGPPLALRARRSVLAAGGFPLAHGERSQREALWGTLAWATTHPEVRGVILADAADYGRITGLRATGGRLRPAVPLLAQGVRLLRETIVQ